MAVLAAGLLAGPAGNETIQEGELLSFFDTLRRWYGHDETLLGQRAPLGPGPFDLGTSADMNAHGIPEPGALSIALLAGLFTIGFSKRHR